MTTTTTGRGTQKKTTAKQDAILDFLLDGGNRSAGYSLDDILEAVPEARTYGPSSNQKRHLRECLNRLIKKGRVVRQGRGIYVHELHSANNRDETEID